MIFNKTCFFYIALITCCINSKAQQTQKPILHGKNWLAITGKPLAATAGAITFNKGGNAVDASCAMLAATCTMWDVLSWGGETQTLIYHPKLKKVIGINALGYAPQAANVNYFKERGYEFPPEYGPLAAIVPGTVGGLCIMLAEYGTMSLQQILEPAINMAKGYPIEAQTANSIERNKEQIKKWPYSKKVFLTHVNEKREAPEAGEIFVQQDLLSTLQKMVEAEQQALKNKKTRKQAIMAAYDRFYKGDIAKEYVRGCKEQGGIISEEDLAAYKPVIEEPLSVNYKGIEVYKLSQWTQGPAMLQALNILEQYDLQKMGYNSSQYIHTLYQAMNMAFADRDFYYGDPYMLPEEPMKGLLSKAYAKQRALEMDTVINNAFILPGNPYAFENKVNPYEALLNARRIYNDTSKTKSSKFMPIHDRAANNVSPDLLAYYNTEDSLYNQRLWQGTTSIQATDKEGWVVSVTPSGGWIPACIAGKTGIGMSQRLQSFVLNDTLNPFNVIAPRKRPRVTLTPTMALKNGKPFLSFAVQGGDTQDQNLLQFFLNMVEFGMNVQQATEAANINSNQLWLSLGGTNIADRKPKAGEILLQQHTKPEVKEKLTKMGYRITLAERTSGPINAIFFDGKHGGFWGGSSNHGDDYGICW
jgi:gamma-glutamyltranspeptidase / glutathione hydrolase